jgi:RNA polymerase sigma factor (sigma-70 family)
MQRLPDNQRQMLILRYMLDWKIKEIAYFLEMNENTVSVNIKRALTRLRDEWPKVE